MKSQLEKTDLKQIDLSTVKAAYLAPEGYVNNLLSELTGVVATFDRLVVTNRKPYDPAWCHNVWLDPVVLKIDSITDAAKKLKEIKKNWVFFPYKEIRRSKLIEEQLSSRLPPKIEFPFKDSSSHLSSNLLSQPESNFGSWTLLDKDTLLASPNCSSPFPNGEPDFKESKIPPSRAYLKLWEAFTILKRMPEKGDRCLDVGACPGGWTWVLASLGARVLAIDRAPLDSNVSKMPGVEFKKGDAFTYKPKDPDSFDWIFSDLICYPEKLYEWVESWRKAGKAKNFLCTLKFQGEKNLKGNQYEAKQYEGKQYEIIKKFKAIPNSKVFHLSANKHELTWASLDRER